VAEVAPEEPYITFRTNSYNDTILGDNLYAANSEIKRNDSRHYCRRYINIMNHIGDGTGIGSQENWGLMKNYSNQGIINLQFMQFIPEWNQLKLSVYQDGTPAYQNDPVTYDVTELFSLPVSVNDENWLDDQLKILPNPAAGEVVVTCRIPVGSRQSAVGSHVTLKIYDLQGRMIATVMDEEKPARECNVRFDASELSAGIYLIRLQVGEERVVRKLVVQ